MKTRYLLINQKTGECKIVYTEFGSPYFCKLLAAGYICKNEVRGWNVSLHPLKVSQKLIDECNSEVLSLRRAQQIPKK